MEFEIKEFFPELAEERLWELYFNHREKIILESDPDTVLPSREKWKRQIISEFKIPYFKKRIFNLFIKEINDEIPAIAIISAETDKSPSYESNKHILMLTLSVLPKFRRKGIAQNLIKYLIKIIKKDFPYVSEFITNTVTESGVKFIEKLGGKLSLETFENRLYLKDIDWDMVKRWKEEGIRKNPDTTIKTVLEIPEEDLIEFSKIYTEITNQTPHGEISITQNFTPELLRSREKEYKKNKALNITIYTKEKNNLITSVTEIVYDKDPGHMVYQMLTGVRNEFRGRGIGKWIKAEMLLHIKNNFNGIKYISTQNATVNEPMLHINNLLGFKKHLRVKIYEIKLSNII
ncbi:MAG TPA: GNAT family N-acetyltransferase [Elusimicrobiales bacterium]|jgi:GNAT superfamily N-acetyltransferase|nr:GNAT family N-acetyltransferase [Elusimicrobiales bacterium]HOL62324.1 GNAT family N-acetyltransferase [Elusimicrobiales bacterium]HPO95569.1 GNAT family N-acetyltransferase [Elusimicrobiales bacterium]